MANRIVYHILPSVADQVEVEGTQGVVDYKALRKAVEGRKNILKYGPSAVISELKYYKGKNNLYQQASDQFDRGNIAEAMSLAAKGFAEKGAWIAQYGGMAWENIAKTLRSISWLDHTFDALRKDKDNPKKIEQEISVMRQLVVQMDIFDGLMHNTGSIFEKMIDQEFDTEGHADPMVALEIEHDKVKRLMNSKELTNPLDVYKVVEPELEESNDIHQYRDWNTKLRNHPVGVS